MEKNQAPGEWTGFRGRFYAWLFSTYSRKILEFLIFGNYWSALKREISKRIKTGDETVLDIGAGSGNFSIILAKKLRSGKVISLDLSTEMTDFLMAKARKKSLQDRILVLNRDAGATGLENVSVDWIVSGNCMHEISNPKKIWTEMHRVLKPNGAVFVVDFLDWHGFHGKEAHGPYSVRELTDLFSGAQFRNISVVQKRHFVVGIAEK